MRQQHTISRSFKVALGHLQVEAIHLPGHTRGHSGFRVSDGVFFLSDIDLTGFGPYYGDVWSDLEDFERSLEQVRDERADYYVTFHHRGVIEGRDEFLRLLDEFHAVIPRRHEAMLEFLAEPHTLDDMVAHRFIYRPHVQHVFADSVERRCAAMHVQRMLLRGEAKEVSPGRFQAVWNPGVRIKPDPYCVVQSLDDWSADDLQTVSH